MQNKIGRPRLTRRTFLKLGSASAGIFFGAASRPAPLRAAPPKRGGTFTLAYTVGLTEFNPVNLVTGHYAFQRALFNTLAHYDANLDLQPELAEKWDFSADGKALTLKLREGVKYHSGREFTSADVKASWEFASTDEKTTMRTLFRSIKQVDTPEKYIAILRFDSINPGVFDALDTMYIIDKEIIAQRAKTGGGTGPFRLDKYLPNDRVEMVPFKDYWEKGKPYLDRYIIRTIPDLSALAVNLESGVVDCIWQPSNIDLVRLRDAGGKFVADLGAPGATMYNLAINVKREPFTNKKARQAMAWCIDRARFCRTTLQGLVEPTCLMWPKHSWAYFPDLEGKIGFDLSKAQSLLKEAGLGSGFETEIVVSSRRYPGSSDLAQIIQADAKKIGVNIKVVDIEPARYDAQVVVKGDHTMTIIAYGRLNRDPGTLVTAAKAFYTAKEGTWTHFESAEYDQLRKELQSTLDREKRKATARKIQELALDECFTNSVAPQQRAWAYASFVKGFTYDMDNAPFMAEVWLDK
jgi:peptide/nickel transport system substrate-binding protein